MFTANQYQQAMEGVTPPPTADAVRKARNRYLDSREAVTAAEEAIHAAAGNRAVSQEQLYVKLQEAKDEMLLAQREFERIAPFGVGLEAKERADQLQAANGAALARAQKALAIEEEAGAKAVFRTRWLAAGGTVETFEQSWDGPDGLWAQELRRRVTESGHTMVDRLRASGRYT